MKEFGPGFRLSVFDMLVLVIGSALSVYSYNINPLVSYIVSCVVCHFFLFCNVVRMSRIPELIWSVVFILAVILSLNFSALAGYVAITIIVSCTVILVVLEIRKPSYHGVLWQKMNPSLPQWFENHHASK